MITRCRGEFSCSSWCWWGDFPCFSWCCWGDFAHKEKHGKSSENPLRIFHAFPRYQYGIDTTYLFYLIVTIEICFSNWISALISLLGIATALEVTSITSITGLFEPPPYPTLFGLLSRSAAIAMSTGVSVGLVQQTINIYQELIRLHPVKTKSLSSGVNEPTKIIYLITFWQNFFPHRWSAA